MTAEPAAVPEGLLEVGRVGRAHGVKGDVFVDLTTDRDERVAVGAELWVRDQWRTIEQSHASGKRWRVHFSGIADRTAAEALTGTVLFAAPIDDPDTLWVHQLIGAVVLETNGIDRGRCTAVIDNPASDLIELDSGALVPVAFVTSVDVTHDGTLVTIDPPPGLFDLDS